MIYVEEGINGIQFSVNAERDVQICTSGMYVVHHPSRCVVDGGGGVGVYNGTRETLESDTVHCYGEVDCSSLLHPSEGRVMEEECVVSLSRSATSRPTNVFKAFTVYIEMQADVAKDHRELNGTLRVFMRLASLSKVLGNHPIHSLSCST